MGERSRQRLERMAALWRREREATHARFAEERAGAPLKERVARGLALMDLVVDETDAVPGGRHLLWLVTRRPGGLAHARIGTGDPVRLWWEEPEGPDAVRGTVARRHRERLAVVVDEDLPDRYEDGGFRLDRDAPEATFDRGDRAIRTFLEAKSGSATGWLREVLLGDERPAFDPEPRWKPFDADLNRPQREAVSRALAAQDVALVHGPPGTGKTRTLVEIARQAVRRGESVLATAASNTAVDNLAERLARAGVEVVRVGHPARVSDAVQARTLDALLEHTEAWRLARRWTGEARDLLRRVRARSDRGTLDRRERRAMREEVGRLFRDARRQLRGAEDRILDGATVICATAAGADASVLRDRTFDLVVLDEATQAPDPIALVALARARRAVLAGDPRQLPPTVIDPEADREGLGRTVFERLAVSGDDDLLRMLVVQHRMHETLMSFPSAASYEGRLVASDAVRAHRLVDLPGVAPDPLRPGPLVFVDTAGKGWEERRGEEDPSTWNPRQAERTAAEIRRLLGRGVPPGDVAVITPYHAQARRLRHLLSDAVRAGLEVGTVDGFQGREKEAVVVDLVRSNDAGDLGFLRDVRRMNVALTRARRFLLVLGDSATLGRHPYYAAFLEAAEGAGAWQSAWGDEAPPFEADEGVE
ncbi:MAG: AAA domain-containing protein [Myxococcota bacterium]